MKPSVDAGEQLPSVAAHGNLVFRRPRRLRRIGIGVGVGVSAVVIGVRIVSEIGTAVAAVGPAAIEVGMDRAAKVAVGSTIRHETLVKRIVTAVSARYSTVGGQTGQAGRPDRHSQLADCPTHVAGELRYASSSSSP